MAASSQEGKKKSPLPFPSHPPDSLHPRAEAAVRSQCQQQHGAGLGPLSFPPALLPFLLTLLAGAGLAGLMDQGRAVTTQNLSLPSSVLSSCISVTLPSLSLLLGILGSLAPFCPSPGYHQCIDPSQAISFQLCLFLPAPSDYSLSLSSPALHLLAKHSQCWLPMVLPCLYLLPIPCQPQHSGESGCLSSSSLLPASILSLPNTSHLPVCPGIRLTFAALNSAWVIHPLSSLLVNSLASPANAPNRERSPSSCSASQAVPALRCLASASLFE